VLKKNIANRPQATRNIATFAPRTVRTAKIDRPHERLGGTALDHDESDQEDRGERHETDHLGRSPAGLARSDDPVHERDQATRDGHCSGQVEAPVRFLVLRLGHDPQRQDERDDADRNVDEEDPGPRERVGEDPAEEQADGAAADRDRRPHAHRFGPLRAFSEGRGHDREGGRRHERRAEALDSACDDQPGLALCEAADQRRDRKDDDAEEEHALAPDQVARAATEQEESAEEQRVGVDDPLQVRIGHVEVVLDRRQSDVHDRRVEDDHELREADEDENDPGIDRAGRAGAIGHGGRRYLRGATSGVR